MFRFWGDGSQEAKDLVDAIKVRSTENFNWTFIFILAVIFYIYWSEIHKKNTETVCAGLALYGVHWLYEICNAVIGKIFGYPLWSVSNQSTTFILLIGVCWELSMMFSIFLILSGGHGKSFLYLGLSVVGRDPGLYHHLYPVLSGQQLCAGYGTGKTQAFSALPLGTGRSPAPAPDPGRRYLTDKRIRSLEPGSKLYYRRYL